VWRYVFTGFARAGGARPAGRIGAGFLAEDGFDPSIAPAVFVCGPSSFVEAVANLLLAAGHDARRVKTERFGPSGSEPSAPSGSER
jgi:ferredoxin-NADP reductase